LIVSRDCGKVILEAGPTAELSITP